MQTGAYLNEGELLRGPLHSLVVTPSCRDNLYQQNQAANVPYNDGPSAAHTPSQLLKNKLKSLKPEYQQQRATINFNQMIDANNKPSLVNRTDSISSLQNMHNISNLLSTDLAKNDEHI